MKVTTTNELDFENDELIMMCQTPDPTERPKLGEGDGTVETGEEEDEEGDIKPYE